MFADCKVNGSALKVDELAVSAAAGAVSGWIGGSGANQYKALSNTIKTASKTTARFTRLISTKGSASLAVKRIIYHCIYHLFILLLFLVFLILFLLLDAKVMVMDVFHTVYIIFMWMDVIYSTIFIFLYKV